MAHRQTRRRCPYCSEEIELGQCPIVGTSIQGLGGLGGLDPSELDEISLPSETVPLRRLKQTGWPVLAEAPNQNGGRRSRERSLLGRALGDSGGALEPLNSGKLPREDVPARACPASVTRLTRP